MLSLVERRSSEPTTCTKFNVLQASGPTNGRRAIRSSEYAVKDARFRAVVTLVSVLNCPTVRSISVVRLFAGRSSPEVDAALHGERVDPRQLLRTELQVVKSIEVLNELSDTAGAQQH